MTGTAKTDDLIIIEGNDPESRGKARLIIEDLASKPEVREVLLRAKRHHQKPLRFIIGEHDEVAKYERTPNTVYFDPEKAKTATFHDASGKETKASPQALIAHEIYHAGDEDHREQTQQYKMHLQAIMSQLLPPIDFGVYKNRFDAARNEKPKLEALLGEIYDKHAAPFIATLGNYSQSYIRMAKADGFIKEYIQKYEKPAIHFSNAIATKYYNQPAQSLDYLSMIKIDDDNAMSREDFVRGLSEQIYRPSPSIEETPSRGGKRTEPKPREGGWTNT